MPPWHGSVFWVKGFSEALFPHIFSIVQENYKPTISSVQKKQQVCIFSHVPTLTTQYCSTGYVEIAMGIVQHLYLYIKKLVNKHVTETVFLKWQFKYREKAVAILISILSFSVHYSPCCLIHGVSTQ